MNEEIGYFTSRFSFEIIQLQFLKHAFKFRLDYNQAQQKLLVVKPLWMIIETLYWRAFYGIGRLVIAGWIKPKDGSRLTKLHFALLGY